MDNPSQKAHSVKAALFGVILRQIQNLEQLHTKSMRLSEAFSFPCLTRNIAAFMLLLITLLFGVMLRQIQNLADTYK